MPLIDFCIPNNKAVFNWIEKTNKKFFKRTVSNAFTIEGKEQRGEISGIIQLRKCSKINF